MDYCQEAYCGKQDKLRNLWGAVQNEMLGPCSKSINLKTVIGHLDQIQGTAECRSCMVTQVTGP